jgi:hypothetical protein
MEVEVVDGPEVVEFRVSSRPEAIQTFSGGDGDVDDDSRDDHKKTAGVFQIDIWKIPGLKVKNRGGIHEVDIATFVWQDGKCPDGR